MSFFILVYILVILALCYMVGVYGALASKNTYTKYIAIGVVCFTLWLLLYLLSFTTSIDPSVIVIYSRFLYVLTFLGACSMTLAFYFYEEKKGKIKKFGNYENVLIVILLLILLVSITTDFFIKDVVFDIDEQVYIETFGFLFVVIQILYLINPTISSVISWKKYNRLQGINKRRFFYLSVGYHIFIFLILIFLGILPSLDVWVFQKEQIFFFLPFLFGLWYPLYRYRFGNITIGLGKTIIFVCSLILTLLLLTWVKEYFSNIGGLIKNFWGFPENSLYFEYVIVFVGFFLLYRFLMGKFLSATHDTQLSGTLNTAKTSLPPIQTLDQLNDFMRNTLATELRISGAQVIAKDEIQGKNALTTFFEKNQKESFFINDPIFIEENSKKYRKLDIEKDLSPEISLYFPLKNEARNIIGFLGIGAKPMKEYFSSDEIGSYIDFSHSVASHLRYMNISTEIRALNLSLDKKVDEKTIEYNNLISKQKEFIAYLGHEVRNPVTNIIFLSDDIKSSVQKLKSEKQQGSLLEDVNLLNEELQKIADLTKSIFSSEKMDLGKIKLYKEKITLYDFIYNEIRLLQKTTPHIEINSELENVGVYDIDEIQFREALHNLIVNAIKYASKQQGRILVTLSQDSRGVKITVEDNGKGLSEYEVKNIFDKYATGNNDSIGLGMGLYLCKRIVELHGGEIHAGKSKKLGGARFTINL